MSTNTVILATKLAELTYDLDGPNFESVDEERAWLHESHRLVHLFDTLSHVIQAIKEMRECVRNWDAQKGKADGLMLEKVMDTINHKLADRRFHVVFAMDRRPSGFIMQIMPSSLLAALWVQLGQGIVENKKFRSCATCQKWFELTPAINRTSRAYCSEACRSRAYRIRKEQAVRMADNGKNIAEIARVLGSTVGTVATWLKPRVEKS